MAATIIDIARAAGVSHTTVSLALRPDSRISAVTRRKVMRAAGRLKYIPNLAARHLRHGRPRLLGALVLDITNPFWARMAREVETTARRLGYHVMIAESQWDPEREKFHIERMIQSRVRGLLVCFSEKTDEGQALLDRFAVPHVALDTFPAGYEGPFVANDLVQAGRLAAQHLIEVGCRNPLLFLPNHRPRRFSSLEHLRRGFSAGLRRAGVRFGAGSVYDAGWMIEDGMRAFERVRASGAPVDAILCANDLCALGVLEAATHVGVRVGRDLALMGIDNLPVSQLSVLSLTSIREPDAALAEIATRALVESIEKDEPLRIRRWLEPELVVRNSTRLH